MLHQPAEVGLDERQRSCRVEDAKGFGQALATGREPEEGALGEDEIEAPVGKGEPPGIGPHGIDPGALRLRHRVVAIEGDHVTSRAASQLSCHLTPSGTEIEDVLASHDVGTAEQSIARTAEPLRLAIGELARRQ
jgi:hypothetical protein